MAISVVQRVQGSKATVTVPSVTVGNSLLVIAVYAGSPSAADGTISDNKGNSYSAVVSKLYGFINTADGIEICLAQGVAGGSTTVTFSGGYSSYIVYTVAYELSGVGGVDVSTAQTGSSSVPNAGAMTTTHSGDFIYSIACAYNASPSAPSGFTSAGIGNGSFDAYGSQSSAGSINVTWGSSNVSYWLCGAVALYAAPPAYSLTWNGVGVSAWDGVALSGWDGV